MSPTLRVILSLFGLEIAFTPLVSFAFLAALEVEEGRGTALAVLSAIHIVRFILQSIIAAVCLRPVERWRALAASNQDSAEVTVVAARAAYRMPYVFGAWYTAIYVPALPLAVAITYLFFPDSVPLDPHVKPAAFILTLPILFGAPAIGFPIAEWLLGREMRTLSLRLQGQGVPYRATGMSLSTRLMAFAVICAAAPALWLGGVDYLNTSRGRSRVLSADNHVALLELAATARTPDPATGKLPDPAVIADGHPGAFVLAGSGTTVRGAVAQAAFTENEPIMRRLKLAIGQAPSGRFIDVPTGIAVAYTRIDPSTVIGIVAQTDVGVGAGFWRMQIPFFLLVALWSTITAWVLSRSTVSPILKLSTVVEDIRRGRVENVERVAIYHHDETGKLAADVNGMLDVLRTLSEQAKSIGTGDLSTTFSIGGELGESFRAQLESLRTIVGHLAQNATQLGAAATELYAASQEQETAAGHQSAGVNEVGKTMDSLLAAAAHISEATQGVLAKAERTRETTDRTAEKIGELSAHAGRIGEILDVIREIADRSDLLALNASLEGTRAGEAGRGFTLVAAEMRKLAERVMASVGDIKQLVADVRGSVATTIMVTEESAKLADGTTESARQISLVTQQQSSGTEQAAHSMRDVANMLTQSLSATQQMRALAANLKGQAEQLTTIVARFRISNGSEASA